MGNKEFAVWPVLRHQRADHSIGIGVLDSLPGLYLFRTHKTLRICVFASFKNDTSIPFVSAKLACFRLNDRIILSANKFFHDVKPPDQEPLRRLCKIKFLADIVSRSASCQKNLPPRYSDYIAAAEKRLSQICGFLLLLLLFRRSEIIFLPDVPPDTFLEVRILYEALLLFLSSS